MAECLVQPWYRRRSLSYLNLMCDALLIATRGLNLSEWRGRRMQWWDRKEAGGGNRRKEGRVNWSGCKINFKMMDRNIKERKNAIKFIQNYTLTWTLWKSLLSLHFQLLLLQWNPLKLQWSSISLYLLFLFFRELTLMIIYDILYVFFW